MIQASFCQLHENPSEAIWNNHKIFFYVCVEFNFNLFTYADTIETIQSDLRNEGLENGIKGATMTLI